MPMNSVAAGCSDFNLMCPHRQIRGNLACRKRSEVPARCLHNGHDSGANRRRKLGPCANHGAQIGIIYYVIAGSAPGSARGPDKVGIGRRQSGWGLLLGFAVTRCN
jgi:hypothetical protein